MALWGCAEMMHSSGEEVVVAAEVPVNVRPEGHVELVSGVYAPDDTLINFMGRTSLDHFEEVVRGGSGRRVTACRIESFWLLRGYSMPISSARPRQSEISTVVDMLDWLTGPLPAPTVMSVDVYRLASDCLIIEVDWQGVHGIDVD